LHSRPCRLSVDNWFYFRFFSYSSVQLPQ
jgi:hypothetical protein